MGAFSGGQKGPRGSLVGEAGTHEIGRLVGSSPRDSTEFLLLNLYRTLRFVSVVGEGQSAICYSWSCRKKKNGRDSFALRAGVAWLAS